MLKKRDTKNFIVRSLLISWRNNFIKKDAPSGRSEAIHLSAMKPCHFSSFPMLTMCFAIGHVWADELDPTCAAGPVLEAGSNGLLLTTVARTWSQLTCTTGRHKKKVNMRVHNYYYFHDTTATRERTNTSNHFTNKKPACYATKYSQFSSIHCWLTQMEN